MTKEEIENNPEYKIYIDLAYIYAKVRFKLLVLPKPNYVCINIRDGNYTNSSYPIPLATEYIFENGKYKALLINIYLMAIQTISKTIVHELTHYKQDVYNTIDRNHIVSTKGYDKDVCEDEAINESKIFGMMLNIIIPKIDPYTITYEDLVHTVSDYVYSLDKE